MSWFRAEVFCLIFKRRLLCSKIVYSICLAALESGSKCCVGYFIIYSLSTSVITFDSYLHRKLRPDIRIICSVLETRNYMNSFKKNSQLQLTFILALDAVWKEIVTDSA